MSSPDREHLGQNEARTFFDRPGELVAGDLAHGWVKHQDRREVFGGQEGILALDTDSGVRIFKVDGVIYYDDEYTKSRWPRTRGPEIATLEPGEVIGYAFHRSVLTFIKVGGIGSSANIQLNNLTEVDRQGEPRRGRDAQIGPAKVAQILGLEHQMRAQVSVFNFRGSRAFLISAGNRQLSAEEIRNIEEEILGSQ